MSTDEPDGDDGLTPAQRAEVKKLVANETAETETTRRGALKMGGGLLGLGLLGSSGLAASTSPARAQQSAGQVGTQSSPLDVYADMLWASSITDASSGNSYDVDELAGGGDIQSDDVGRIDVQPTEPSNPTAGDIWIQTN